MTVYTLYHYVFGIDFESNLVIVLNYDDIILVCGWISTFTYFLWVQGLHNCLYYIFNQTLIYVVVKFI